MRLGKTFVDRICLVAIWFGDPPGKVLRKTLDYIHGPISRTTVNDDVFYVWVILIQHGEHGRFDETSVVVGGGNDRDERFIHNSNWDIPRVRCWDAEDHR